MIFYIFSFSLFLFFMILVLIFMGSLDRWLGYWSFQSFSLRCRLSLLCFGLVESSSLTGKFIIYFSFYCLGFGSEFVIWVLLELFILDIGVRISDLLDFILRYLFFLENMDSGRPARTYIQQLCEDIALKTCQRRWTIGRSGERGSGISLLAALHDDDDDDEF